jgi:hypothetical protein
MNFLTELFSSQLEGLLIGITITVISVLIIFYWKGLWNFIASIPNLLFKHKMQKSISKTINLANEEIGLALMPKVELRIAKYDTPLKDLQDKLIIFVKRENEPKVYVSVITQILNESFLRDAKKHIDIDSFETIKYTMGKSLITKDIPVTRIEKITKDALRYYDRKMDKILTGNTTLQLANEEELILSKRLFKTVLLQELYALGEKMLGTIPSEECKKESRQFIDFLYNIAGKDEYERKEGKEPPLLFIKTYLKVGLVLVKKREILDLSNHLRAVKRDINNGVISIYIMGWGEENVRSIERDFAKWLHQVAVEEYNKKWRVEKIIKYKLPVTTNNRDVPGICCIFRHKSWISQ